MTARQRAILRLLVEEYIKSQAPVPSARVAGGLGLSPALARYELIALEEMGFLTKPHASAGRIPTRQGFRQYSLSLLPPPPLPRELKERLARALEGAREPEAFLVKMAAGLSGYPARLRLWPRTRPRVLQVHLSTLPQGVLAVMVLEGGQVREARLPFPLLPEEVRRAEEALVGPFLDLPKAPKGLEGLFGALDRILALGFVQEYREGLGEVLKEPEAREPGFLARLVALYESGSESPPPPPGRVDVRVGEVEGIATVQAGLARGEWVGELSLFGPMRMRYAEALSLVQGLGEVYTGGRAG